MPLRALTRDDAATVAPFVAMAAFPPGSEPSAAALDALHVRRWSDGWADEVGVVWDEDGRALAAAWARRVEPVLARDARDRPLPEVIVAVVEEARGHGLGRRVLEALTAQVVARGWPGLVLAVSDRNAVAVRLYERVGFRRVGRTPTGLHVMVWLVGRPDADTPA